jgi:hypothetical protein
VLALAVPAAVVLLLRQLAHRLAAEPWPSEGGNVWQACRLSISLSGGESSTTGVREAETGAGHDTIISGGKQDGSLGGIAGASSAGPRASAEDRDDQAPLAALPAQEPAQKTEPRLDAVGVSSPRPLGQARRPAGPPAACPEVSSRLVLFWLWTIPPSGRLMSKCRR